MYLFILLKVFNFKSNRFNTVNSLKDSQDFVYFIIIIFFLWCLVMSMHDFELHINSSEYFI